MYCRVRSPGLHASNGKVRQTLPSKWKAPVRNIVPATDERAMQAHHLTARCAIGAGKDRTTVEAGSLIPTVFTMCGLDCPSDYRASHDITRCFNTPRHGGVPSWANGGASAVANYSDPVFGHTQAVLNALAWPSPKRSQT